MNAPPQSFQSLLAAHATLDAILLGHQELLVMGEFQQALSVLETYSALLSCHMHQEEHYLMPIFARPPQAARWPVELYTGQHQKLLKLLAGCREQLAHALASKSCNRRLTIALLDRQTTYKHLSEHHDGAERQGFFPALDEKATASERDQLVLRCHHEWQAELARHEPVLAATRHRLRSSEP